jgi:hypothetical protein
VKKNKLVGKMAKLKTSKWYEGAARTIGIKKASSIEKRGR